MKTLTLSISSTLFSELQSMCQSEQDTPEKIAAGILYDALYGDDIEELWHSYGHLADAFETDADIAEAMKNISDVLIICEDTGALRKEKAHQILEDTVEFLEAYAETQYDGSRKLALNFMRQTYDQYKEALFTEAKRLQSLQID